MICHFYVYAYLRDDNTPYYIGKGHGKRAWKKHKNISTPTKLSNIVILEKNLTELGAFAIERRMIRWYGRKDLGTGILRNLTDGGDGATGKRGPQKASRSAEHNAKISLALKGVKFTQERKNGLCGRKQSDDTVAKRINKNIGKKRTPEQIERIRQGTLGKKRTPEQIERIRLGAIIGNAKRKERELLNVK
jgi:hypothetical protein